MSDVGSYQHFIPFCSASRVLSVIDETQNTILLDAELTVQFLAFKESYVSRVTCIPQESVQVCLKRVLSLRWFSFNKAVASSTPLFKELTTTWRFQSIPESTPSAAPTSTVRAGLPSKHPSDSSATLVSLDLAFAFASPIHGAVSSSFFGQVSRLMVNAFEERCTEVYGGKAW